MTSLSSGHRLAGWRLVCVSSPLRVGRRVLPSRAPHNPPVFRVPAEARVISRADCRTEVRCVATSAPGLKGFMASREAVQARLCQALSCVAPSQADHRCLLRRCAT
jgi:hypothetical protein